MDHGVGVMFLDAAGHVHDATASVCELLGVATVDELRSPALGIARTVSPALRIIGDSAKIADLSFEFGGGSRMLRCHIHPMTDAGRVAYVVLVQAAEHVAAMDGAVRLASRAQMLGSVHTTAAHDFRDSLNSMAINIELLGRTLESEAAQQKDTAVQQRCLTALRQELRKLAKVTGGALEESRPSGDERKRVDLGLIVEATMAVLRSRAQRQRVQMKFTPPSREVEVMGLPAELRHALFNLAVNALEAMPAGGELTFDLAVDGSDAILDVADTGAGIPSYLGTRIWEPLFSTKHQGLGLGLCVVKDVAASHGGAATCSSRDTGAAFTLRLPLAR